MQAVAGIANLVEAEARHVDGRCQHFAFRHDDDAALRETIDHAGGDEVGAVAIDRLLQRGGDERVIKQVQLHARGIEVEPGGRGLAQRRVALDDGGGIQPDEARAARARLGRGAVTEREIFGVEQQRARAALACGRRGRTEPDQERQGDAEQHGQPRARCAESW